MTQDSKTSSVLKLSKKQGFWSLHEVSYRARQPHHQVTVLNPQHQQQTKSAASVYRTSTNLQCHLKEDNHESGNIDEFQRYLREPVRSRDENLFAYWRKTGKQNFPGLCSMVMKYLATAATQVRSEKLFSTAGNAVTCRREKLCLDHVQQLHFLHENL